MMEAFSIQELKTDRLRGSNLIEASAGTGKTYSIALLALRLIMEKDIPIHQILMVTFTNAAVAELQDRVRKFLVQANNYVEGEEIENKDIGILIKSAMDSFDEAVVSQRLRASLLLMDEAAIVTIHSFCQMVLSRYAFETRQIFGADLQTDISAIIEDEVNNFWRKHITTLPPGLLALLDLENYKSELFQLIKRSFSGQHYAGFDESAVYSINGEEMLQTIESLQAEADSLYELVKKNYLKYRDSVSVILSKTKSSKLYKALENIDEWIKEVNCCIVEDKHLKIIEKLPSSLVENIKSYFALQEQLNAQASAVKRSINFFAIQTLLPNIGQRLTVNNILTFDHLIANLYHAVTGQNKNSTLIEKVRGDYKAVFIDEFQDTDSMQFKIFDKLFIESSETITFFIGDPKQSIYAFRGADVEAYLQASDIVENRYSMDKNFRSAADMIGATGKFFLPVKDFDTFYYGNENNGIRFNVVHPHHMAGAVLLNGKQTPGIELASFVNKDLVFEHTAAQISQLLWSNTNFQIQTLSGEIRKIKPADIGVLVRTSKDGAAIKLLLDALNIPSVQVNDEKVLHDDVANDISYLLAAVLQPDISNIRKALFSDLLGWSIRDLEALDEEAVLESFRRYQQTWAHQSVYEMLSQIKADFKLEPTLLKKSGGQRTLANFIHIMQLLHQYQAKKGLTPEELLMWLNKSRTKLENEGDEYELQMESDEEAVKIVTIHKSKGLEYNIVFCPGLSFDKQINTGRVYAEFKDILGKRTFAEAQILTDEQRTNYITQTERENRRLMYVAITRAVYKCYILYSTRGFNEANSSLYPFITAAGQTGNDHLIKEKIPAYNYTSDENTSVSAIKYDPARIRIEGLNWRKMSYSSLSAKSAAHTVINEESAGEDYDRFAFNDLAFGTRTGNLLHFLFETIEFGSDQYWNRSVEKALKGYAKEKELYAPFLPILIHHAVHAKIKVADREFELADVRNANTIREMEFNFLVKPTALPVLQNTLQLADDIRFSAGDTDFLEGFLNGFIDLFFEHDGKYYVLDWKSNYLGNTPAAYTPAQLKLAMTENNYHLQYVFYTIAAHKYLKSRLAGYDYDKHFGGVIYVFLRGVREGSSSGIFTNRLEKKWVEDAERLLSKSG